MPPNVQPPMPRSLLLFAVVALAAAGAQEPTPPPGRVVSEAPTVPGIPADVRPAAAVTDAERLAIQITALDLDLHLIPEQAHLEAHGILSLRNTGSAPLGRIPLQLSSSLRWLSASAGGSPVPFTQSPIATDADHTGYAQEAVFTPAVPLLPGTSLTLSVLYMGEVRRNADRLELIGAPHDRAIASDWDEVAPADTGLRGFGNVLWYPVAAAPAHLGAGRELAAAVATQKRADLSLTMRLRLTVEYDRAAPVLAIFNGHLVPFTNSTDTPSPVTTPPESADQLPPEATRGLATANFASAPVGFRIPSLFVTAQVPQTTPDRLLTIVSSRPEALETYSGAVRSLQPLLASLFGPVPRAPLLLLDHAGEPFEDEAFLATPLNVEAQPAAVASDLVRALTHAWLDDLGRASVLPLSSPGTLPAFPGLPGSSLWIDQGLPELVSLEWTERIAGREAALGLLRQAAPLVAFAEDEDHPQPLASASSDVFLRLKASFVFAQLRELLGDDLFTGSLNAYRLSLTDNPRLRNDPKAFQKAVEKAAGRDLGWFFDDWVYADRGLPDLTIVSANPRALPARGGKSGGFLVAVEVRNDGDAVADVPVTVRAGTLFSTERLRIAAHSAASTRIVFEGAPESVEVNDGSVPELRTSSHRLDFAPVASAH